MKCIWRHMGWREWNGSVWLRIGTVVNTVMNTVLS
jgi:hypothetical protein